MVRSAHSLGCVMGGDRRRCHIIVKIKTLLSWRLAGSHLGGIWWMVTGDGEQQGEVSYLVSMVKKCLKN